MAPAVICPICGPNYQHGQHADDSYGACVICREYVPHTDDETVGVAWPCPTVRLERLRSLAKSGASWSHLNGSGVMVRHNGTLWECEAERCIAARELAWTPDERAAKVSSTGVVK